MVLEKFKDKTINIELQLNEVQSILTFEKLEIVEDVESVILKDAFSIYNNQIVLNFYNDILDIMRDTERVMILYVSGDYVVLEIGH